ncbi:MAG: diacylglycerol kinase [Candidatus Dormibacteria bacterium]
MRSFLCAGRGFRLSLGRDPNLRIHLLVAVAVLGLAAWLRPGSDGLAILLLATGLVVAAELLNSALEVALDALHPELHPGLGMAKDVAAGAVLAAAGAALLTGLAVLGPPLWRVLGWPR